MLTLVRAVDDLPEGIDRLADEALSEGYNHITRLIVEWRQGIERFTADGCVLLAGFAALPGEAHGLVAVGGITRDFEQGSKALRMRRFFVSQRHRRQGFGRQLANALIEEAMGSGAALVLHTDDERGRLFWESLGFVPERNGSATHRLP